MRHKRLADLLLQVSLLLVVTGTAGPPTCPHRPQSGLAAGSCPQLPPSGSKGHGREGKATKGFWEAPQPGLATYQP